MALEITYYTGTDGVTRQVYGQIMKREAVTLTGSSADAGSVPGGAVFARVTAGEACRVSNTGNADTNGQYLASGAFIDIEVPKSGNFKGMTA